MSGQITPVEDTPLLGEDIEANHTQSGYLRRYSIFKHYIWPKSLMLRFSFVFCFLLVGIERYINVLVPHQLTLLINAFSAESQQEAPGIPWGKILLFVFYYSLHNRLLSAARSMLWVRIRQLSYHKVSTQSFEHVHSLGLDFHLQKKTGEVVSTLRRGKSICKLFEQVAFQAIPLPIDLLIAIGYLYSRFDAQYALVVAIVAMLHITILGYLRQWRAKINQVLIDAQKKMYAVM